MKKYVIITKNNCPQCNTLKGRMEMKGVPYITVNVDTKEGSYYRGVLLNMGFRSVPQIFEHDAYSEDFLGKHVRPEEILG